MTPARGSLLLVSADAKQNERLLGALGRKHYAVEATASGKKGLRHLGRSELDAVLVDLDLPDMEGLEFCKRAAAEGIPAIAVARKGTLESAIASMRAGAYDYLMRPLRLETVNIAVARAVQHRSLRRELSRLREAVQESQRFDELTGSSPVMRRLFKLLDRVSASDAAVLITGETGTGKELTARAVHRRSRRRGGPFVAVNCAALPEALLETELFGHTKGAFTDARTSRRGLFLQADGGTLFLDEVGEMPKGLQVKLLRALQERQVRPVGSDREHPFDARIVAATNRDLEAEVAAGSFRSDLYYRLNVIQVDLPPLRERGSDVLLLAQHFLDLAAARSAKEVVGLESEAARRMLEYPWPGNVRELENSIERAVALTESREIGLEDLPNRVQRRQQAAPPPPADPDELLPLVDVERAHILRVLTAVGGNKTRAASVLGLDRKTLYRKLKEMGHSAPAGAERD
ncbi:MAG: sigma-54 dependent transcriptional regulator [Myxococcota bacterium]|nr:sigma-54 dependent transcriptional regulator [Myxococcota bacterium]